MTWHHDQTITSECNQGQANQLSITSSARHTCFAESSPKWKPNAFVLASVALRRLASGPIISQALQVWKCFRNLNQSQKQWRISNTTNVHCKIKKCSTRAYIAHVHLIQHKGTNYVSNDNSRSAVIISMLRSDANGIGIGSIVIIRLTKRVRPKWSLIGQFKPIYKIM